MDAVGPDDAMPTMIASFRPIALARSPSLPAWALPAAVAVPCSAWSLMRHLQGQTERTRMQSLHPGVKRHPGQAPGAPADVTLRHCPGRESCGRGKPVPTGFDGACATAIAVRES